jgi:hypothetical protein
VHRLWSADRRYEFLCACGSLEQAKSGARNAQALLPPSLLPAAWRPGVERGRGPGVVEAGENLLRFLRNNTQQHGADRDSGGGGGRSGGVITSSGCSRGCWCRCGAPRSRFKNGRYISPRHINQCTPYRFFSAETTTSDRDLVVK